MVDSSQWKTQITAVLQWVIYFYVSTFCLGMYLINIRPLLDLTGGFFFLCYGFIFLVNAGCTIQRLSLPGLMFSAPMLPLVALLSVLSMLPIWQICRW